MKAARGEICQKVIREVEALKETLLANQVVPVSFDGLRRQNPDFEVLQILAKNPFDDEDRDLICHPNRWEGVRAATHATGILKRYFGVESDHTIKDYRKHYRKEKQAR